MLLSIRTAPKPRLLRTVLYAVEMVCKLEIETSDVQRCFALWLAGACQVEPRSKPRSLTSKYFKRVFQPGARSSVSTMQHRIRPRYCAHLT